MKKLCLVLGLLLVCVIARAEGPVEQDSIFASLEPLDSSLPESLNILDAQYSPGGNKLLILAGGFGPGDYWGKDYTLIIRKRKGPYRRLPKFLKVLLPAMVELKIAGEIRVTFPKKETRPDFGICWINERTLLMGVDKPFSGENSFVKYRTVKYDIYPGRFSTVFEEIDQHFRVMDVLGDSYLTPGYPNERHWFLCYNGNPGIDGVLPLIMRAISDKSVQKVLTPLDPDSTYIFSVIVNAEFISKQEVALHKLIMKEMAEVEIAIQLVNLRNGEIRTLSSKTVDTGRGGFLVDEVYDISAFAVSPDGKWIVYSSRKKGMVFLSSQDSREIEISIPKGFKDKDSEWNYRESYHLVVLDWSPDGNKILCNKITKILQWTGYEYKRRVENKLCLLSVPPEVRTGK